MMFSNNTYLSRCKSSAVSRYPFRGFRGFIGFAAVAAGLSLSAASLAQQEITKIIADDDDAGDSYGNACAISGDTAVVGAFEDNGEGTDAGAIYIHYQDGDCTDCWGQVLKVTPDNPVAQSKFGNSVDIDGDIVVAGALKEGPDEEGAAYVFYRDEDGSDAWGQIERLVPDDPGDFDHFGCSVAIAGNTIAVGAPGLSGTNDAVYIFERDYPTTGAWGQRIKITPAIGTGGGDFGGAVSLSGDRLIVGAQLNDEVAEDAGAAYIYDRNEDDPNEWGEIAFLTADPAGAGDEFGISVSIDGDTAAVGAYLETHSGLSEVGSAYIFDKDYQTTDAWDQRKRVDAMVEEAGDHFGHSVSLSGDTLLVGAPKDDISTDNEGSSYIFHRNAGGPHSWDQVAALSASDSGQTDEFGQSVSIDGDLGVVGAWQNDDGGTNSGSSYVYCELDPCPENLDGLNDIGFLDL